MHRRSVSGGGRVSGDDREISAGESRPGEDGLAVNLQEREMRRSEETEVFINTLAGNWAYMRVGRDIPFTARWRDLCLPHGYAVGYRRIETGFEVKPLVRNDGVEVEIVPRISRSGSMNSDDRVRFVAAAGRVRLQPGQWVDIGGVQTAGNELLRAVLASGNRRRSSKSSLRMMVEVR
jgi:hypothetical protein